MSRTIRFERLPLSVGQQSFQLEHIQSLAESMAPEAVIFSEAGIEPNGHMTRFEESSCLDADLEQVLLADKRSLMLGDVDQD